MPDMSEGPDRIWIDLEAVENDDEGSHVTRDSENTHHEYVRADIYAEAVVERDALQAQLDYIMEQYNDCRNGRGVFSASPTPATET